MKRENDNLLEEIRLMRRVAFWSGFAMFVAGAAALVWGVVEALS